MEVGESERPRNSRSRGGCQACKKRKRKCDETRPSCLACQKRGLQCSYYLTLRWDTDAIGSGEQRVSTTAAPGGAAPAATTTTTAATTTPQGGASTSATTANSTTCSAPVPLSAPPAADHQPFEPLRRSSLDIRTVHADAPSSASSSSFSTHIPPTLPPSPADPIEHDLIQEERTRFSKFMEHGIYVLYSTDLQDLLRPLILRLSTESRALRSICVAMQVLLEERTSETFLRYFDRALTSFNAELPISYRSMRPGTLCAGLLLCAACVMQGLPFTHHLGCMADLYGLRDDLSQLDPEMGPDLHHCLEVLGIMDLPTFVLGRSTPYLGFWARFRRIQHVLANGIVGGVEVVTGLPRSLLDIFSRIHEPGAEIEFWLWPGEIGQFPQIHLWNSWRYGGMLLARRASRKVNATAAVASQALHHPGQPGRAPFSGVPRTVVDGVKVTWNTRGQYGYVVKEFPLPSTEQLLCCVLSELDAMERELARPENSHSLVENGFLYPFLAACLQVSLLKAHPEWKVALCRFRDKWLLPGRTQNVDALLAVIDEAWASGDDDFDADAAAQRMNKEIALY